MCYFFQFCELTLINPWIITDVKVQRLDGNENVTLEKRFKKINLCSLSLYHDYSYLLI